MLTSSYTCCQSGHVPKTPAEMQICFSFASLSEVFLGFWLAVLAHILNYELVMTLSGHLTSNLWESWGVKKSFSPPNRDIGIGIGIKYFTH